MTIQPRLAHPTSILTLVLLALALAAPGASAAAPAASAEERIARVKMDLKSDDPAIRQAAISSLVHSDISGKLLAEIRTALDDRDGAVRSAAATAIGNVGAAAVPAVPQLIAQLKGDPVKEARETAARALGRIGKAAGDGKELIDPLRAASADDADPVTRVVAHGALAMINVDLAGQIEALGKYLHHDDALVRMKAAHALGMIGKAARAAAPEIVEVLKSETDSHRRGYVARSLGLTGDPASLPALEAALKAETNAGAQGEMRGAISRLKALASAEEKLNDLIAHAQQGDSAAQLSLAVMYRDGNGVDQDYPQGMHWGHLAADQGNTKAMDFLGYAYLTGRGARRNPKIAFGYFHAAADTSARAAFNLGQCYFGGQGVDLDIPKALAAWKKAAEMGEGRAAAEAAMVYLSGEGIPADPDEALRMATRAAQLADPSGLVILGEIEFQAGKIDDARKNWEKASHVKPVGQTGLPTQPNDNMSAQEGADLLKLIDYRHRKTEPGVFAYVQGPHIHQGYNNCGATATAMLARFQASKIGAWEFKRLCHSPVGTGTDWGELMAAAGKIGLHWKLVTFTPDDEGFDKATAFARSELDAGRPVVIDFRFTGPQFPGGAAGHTLDLVGYIAAEHLYILRNPAIATPGLELITADDLKHYWQSNSYGSIAHGIMSRPAIVIDGSEKQ